MVIPSRWNSWYTEKIFIILSPTTNLTTIIFTTLILALYLSISITWSTHFSAINTSSLHLRFSPDIHTESVYTFYHHQKPTNRANPSRLLNRLLCTSNINLSIIGYFHDFICSTCRRIHVSRTDSENPALLQFIRLLAVINTTLCFCSVMLQ